MRKIMRASLILTTLFITAACSDVRFSSKKDGGGGGGKDPTCSGSACGQATYSWYQGGFGSCSKPCGGGTQTQVVECRNQKDVVVADSSCTGPKPANSRSCNVEGCTSTYTWNIGAYGTCSKTCGTGARTRTVVCQNQNGQTVADSSCPSPKPTTTSPCNTEPCPPDVTYAWQVTPGICSKECGGGTATDVVVCKRNDGTTANDSLCNAATKPPTNRTCNTQNCPVVYSYLWEPQPWSVCSKTCGGGTQSRSLACRRNDGAYVSTTYCNAANKPEATRACNTQTCPTSRTVTQELFVTPALNSVDVILIIDDSSSMKEDQTKLATRMNGLIGDLDALKVDYRVCITSTDITYYKGSPIKWEGLNSVIMSNATPNKSKVFVDTINSLGTEWSSDERGIAALGLMVRDYRGTGCLRPEATLAAILISDEDERSVGGIRALSSQQYKPLEAIDLPDTMRASVSSVYNKPGFVKPFLWNSIIVKPGDNACENAQDAQSSPAFPGRTYAELSNKTGGYIGSICAADYTENLRLMKDRLINSMPGMKLECTPIGNPTVTFDRPITTTVTLTGDELKFSPVIPEGVKIRAVYKCP